MKLSVLYPKIIGTEDPLFKKHSDVYKLCKSYGLSLPVETAKFFRVHPTDYLSVDLTRPTRLPIVIKEITVESEGMSHYYDSEYDILTLEVDISQVVEEGSDKVIIQLYNIIDNE